MTDWPPIPKDAPHALRLALMAERVLPPGAVQRTEMAWPALSVICVCGGTLVAIGPLDSPVGVQCSQCGALDSEAQRYSGPVPDWSSPKIAGEMYYNPQTGRLEEYKCSTG